LRKDPDFRERAKIEYATNYTYLGLKISATGKLHLAVNELKEKTRRFKVQGSRFLYLSHNSYTGHN